MQATEILMDEHRVIERVLTSLATSATLPGQRRGGSARLFCRCGGFR